MLFGVQNTLKPEETKVTDNGVFTPQTVAADIASGIENWRWLITTGFDGYLLGTLCTGTAPIHSPFVALFQGVATGLLRLVMLRYQFSFASALQKIYNRKLAAAQSGGFATAKTVPSDNKTD